jgi:hypothetical protein
MEEEAGPERAKKPPELTEQEQHQVQLVKAEKTDKMNDKNKAKAVLFVPYTIGSTLAKRMREAEEKLMGITGYKLKIVERGGTKLEDLLHRADPCQGQDCSRAGCLLCETKQYTGKNTTQECSKRNVVYKTYCITCQERGEQKIKEEENDEKRELKARGRVHRRDSNRNNEDRKEKGNSPRPSSKETKEDTDRHQKVPDKTTHRAAAKPRTSRTRPQR